jgi:hypothetical protein
MDHFCNGLLHNIKLCKDDDEKLISLISRDVYLNDIIFVNCSEIRSHWKEYKKKSWIDMKIPNEIQRKISKLLPLLRSICKNVLELSLDPKDQKTIVLRLMDISNVITSESYDIKKMITYFETLYKVS